MYTPSIQKCSLLTDPQFLLKYNFKVGTNEGEIESLLQREHFSIILLDCRQKRVNLLSILEKIQKKKSQGRIYLVEDRTSPSELTKLLHHGVYGAIHHPFTRVELETLIQANIRSSIYEFN